MEMQEAEPVANPLDPSIWNRYHNRLVVFAQTSFGLSLQDAEDAVQEIFIKGLINLHRYDTARSFKKWIYAIARNFLIDLLRKRSRMAAGGKSEINEELLSGSPAYSPEYVLFEKETDRLVTSYLHDLANKDRQISFLRFYEGLKYREIGDIMEMPAGTVKYRIHEIRTGLSRYISEN